MPDPLPSTLNELYELASALDADLTRSRTLRRHLPLSIRPETIADHSRRLAQLEAIARAIGLSLDVGVERKPE